jgi:hypothetical protein
MIPLLTSSAVGFYIGYVKYFAELGRGSDLYDAFRWAFLGGALLSPIGLFPGFLLMLLVKTIIAEIRERKTKPAENFYL